MGVLPLEPLRLRGHGADTGRRHLGPLARGRVRPRRRTVPGAALRPAAVRPPPGDITGSVAGRRGRRRGAPGPSAEPADPPAGQRVPPPVAADPAPGPAPGAR